VSNLNNYNKKPEIYFLDIIIKFWEFKKLFVLILIPLLLISILLDSLIPKKSDVQIQLKDFDQIHLDVYPSESILTSIIIKDVTYLGPQSGFGNSVKVSLKFFDHYLNPVLMSKKALIQFSKMNDDKYKLYNYINKNNINVTKALLGVWNYSLILSDGPEIENFFLEYLQYSSNLAWERWKKDILKLEKSKFDQVTRDIGAMNRILEKIDPSYDVTKVIVNLNVIKSMYKEREAIMKKNLNFIENMQNPYNEDWILDGPTKYKFNQKFYTLSKFILPVVLSLIIFFLYILIKLTRQDTQN